MTQYWPTIVHDWIVQALTGVVDRRELKLLLATHAMTTGESVPHPNLIVWMYKLIKAWQDAGHPVDMSALVSAPPLAPTASFKFSLTIGWIVHKPLLTKKFGLNILSHKTEDKPMLLTEGEPPGGPQYYFSDAHSLSPEITAQLRKSLIGYFLREKNTNLGSWVGTEISLQPWLKLIAGKRQWTYNLPNIFVEAEEFKDG